MSANLALIPHPSDEHVLGAVWQARNTTADKVRESIELELVDATTNWFISRLVDEQIKRAIDAQLAYDNLFGAARKHAQKHVATDDDLEKVVEKVLARRLGLHSNIVFGREAMLSIADRLAKRAQVRSLVSEGKRELKQRLRTKLAAMPPSPQITITDMPIEPMAPNVEGRM